MPVYMLNILQAALIGEFIFHCKFTFLFHFPSQMPKGLPIKGRSCRGTSSRPSRRSSPLTQSAPTVVSEGNVIAALHDELRNIKWQLLSLSTLPVVPDTPELSLVSGNVPPTLTVLGAMDPMTDILDLSPLVTLSRHYDAAVQSDVPRSGTSLSSLNDHF